MFQSVVEEVFGSPPSVKATILCCKYKSLVLKMLLGEEYARIKRKKHRIKIIQWRLMAHVNDVTHHQITSADALLCITNGGWDTLENVFIRWNVSQLAKLNIKTRKHLAMFLCKGNKILPHLWSRLINTLYCIPKFKINYSRLCRGITLRGPSVRQLPVTNQEVVRHTVIFKSDIT